MSLESSTQLLAHATVVLAGATALLVLVAVIQLGSLGSAAKKERTLSMCNRYDTCPILHRALRRLRMAHESGAFARDPRSYRVDVVSVLNYFDTIAIGIDQKLYVDKLAYDHAGPLLSHHIKEYLADDKLAASIGVGREHYEHLLALNDRWYPKGKARTVFKDSWFSWLG